MHDCRQDNHIQTPVIVSIGLDIAKTNFEAAVMIEGLGPAKALESKPFDCSAKGVEALLQAAESYVAASEIDESCEVAIRIVMEATGSYSQSVTNWILIQQPTQRVAIVNPSFIKSYGRSLGARNKTDRADAKLIAQYGLERDLTWFEPPSETFKRLRALSRERDALIRERTQIKNRKKENSVVPQEVLKAREAILKALQKQIDRIEKAMMETINDDPEWRNAFQRFQTVPGIGPITALAVLAEVGDLRRFTSSRKLSAFTGIHPQNFESGSSRRRSRLCRMGNGRVRQALYLAALAAATKCKKENSFMRKYRQMVAAGKPKKVALCAVMRKQLLVLRAMMIHATSYRDGEQYGC